MSRTRKIITLALVIGILLLAVGYAVIQNIELKIDGDFAGNINDENYKIKFIEPVTVSNASNIEAKITGDTTGTIEVKNLSAKGDTETATYIIKNESKGLSADLSVSTTNDNTEYFTIKSELGQTSIKENEETTLKITVKLTKTAIEDNIKANVGVLVKAMPVQPGQEGTSEEIKGESQTPVAETFPYLPTGFHQVEGTNLYKGLVIESEDKNQQYVWVEVPKTEEVYPTVGVNLNLDNLQGEELTTAYDTIETDLKAYTAAYSDSSYKDSFDNVGDAVAQDLIGMDVATYNALKQKMLKSVYKNGGFYVGRYELGSTEVRREENRGATTTAVIKQGAYPYTWITSKEAQELAVGLTANIFKNTEYTISLMFGVQWDLVLKYFEDKGYSQTELINGLTWGNYAYNVWTIEGEHFKWTINALRNPEWTTGPKSKGGRTEDVLVTTGASNQFSKQNIYDIAGNVWEWTLESKGNNCIYRGGSYGGNEKAKARADMTFTYANIGSVSARFSLY